MGIPTLSLPQTSTPLDCTMLLPLFRPQYNYELFFYLLCVLPFIHSFCLLCVKNLVSTDLKNMRQSVKFFPL